MQLNQESVYHCVASPYLFHIISCKKSWKQRWSGDI